MKKAISLILSLIMIFSFAVPAFAEEETTGIDKFVDEITSNITTTSESMAKILSLSAQAAKNLEPVIKDMVLSSENWEKAGDAMLKVIGKLFDKANPDTPVEPDTPSEPDLPSFTDILKNLTIGDFVETMKKYFFINVEDIDQTSQDIANLAEYKFVTTENGTKTVYIIVDLEEHPELLNRDLMMQTVKKLYEKQNEQFNEDADILMSYEHIAGELALHAVLYAVTNEYLQITGETEGKIYDLWVKAKRVDLNFDESRIPAEFIQIAGIYITGVFIASMYTIYKSFGIAL